MKVCVLCGAEASGDSGLTFDHKRRRQRVSLEAYLCETHGNLLEKHLKRVIPKRLLEITPEPAQAAAAHTS